jgi:uncharacterized delta-60 repeat protein
MANRPRRRLAPLVTVVLAVAVAGPALAAGEADPTFGTGGVQTLDRDHPAAHVEVLPNGSLIVMGVQPPTGPPAPGPARTMISRLHTNGAVDPGLHIVRTTTGVDLGLRGDGRMLLLDVGRVWSFHPSGAPDTSFGGGDGIADLAPALSANTLEVLPGGGLLVGGRWCCASGRSQLGLARLLPDGSPDPAFGTGGLVHTDVAESARIESVSLDSAGRIVVAAMGDTAAFPCDNFGTESEYVARYLGEGTLDGSFGAAGFVSLPDEPANCTSGTMRVAVQGARILAYDRQDLTALRPDGSIDTAFGSSGRISSIPGTDLELLADGRILTGGAPSVEAQAPLPNSCEIFGVVTGAIQVRRFTAAGKPDPTFGTEGVSTVDLPPVVKSGEGYTSHFVGGDLEPFPDGGVAASAEVDRRNYDTETCFGESLTATPEGYHLARLLDVVPCTITGTAGADTLVGTAGRDVICGLGGNDVVSGGGGPDVVYGGGGNDRLSGDAGKDLLVGGAGHDLLEGGNGIDVFYGGPGVDVCLAIQERAVDCP